jgi:hypothetical protein
MGESILQKIQYVARDKQLYTYLKSMEGSLSLYTARWVRLLFTREVGGWRNALSLWDILFDCISNTSEITSMHPSKYTRPGVTPELLLGEFDLMTVLEMTTASLIWMHRELLLAHDVNEGLQLLTGMDSLQDVDPLISTLLSSLHRLQISPTMAPLLHPDDNKGNRRLSPVRTNRRSLSPFSGAQPTESLPAHARDSLIRFLAPRKTAPPPVRTIHHGLSLHIKSPTSQEAASMTPPQSKSMRSQNLGQTLSELSKSYHFGSESNFAAFLDIGNMFSSAPLASGAKDTETTRRGSLMRHSSVAALSSVPLDSAGRDSDARRRYSLDPDAVFATDTDGEQRRRTFSDQAHLSRTSVDSSTSSWMSRKSLLGSLHNSKVRPDHYSTDGSGNCVRSNLSPTNDSLSGQHSLSLWDGSGSPLAESSSSSQRQRMAIAYNNPNMKILLSAPRLDKSQESLFGDDDDELFSVDDCPVHRMCDQDQDMNDLSISLTFDDNSDRYQ